MNTEKLGRWFTANGEAVVPEPCLTVALQRGVVTLSSQIQAYHAFDSAQAASVVVAARA
jgi:hypothetical protein